jgi:hypothetical protein
MANASTSVFGWFLGQMNMENQYFGKEKHACFYCGQCFESYEERENHVSSEHAEDPKFLCRHCDTRFLMKKDFLIHHNSVFRARLHQKTMDIHKDIDHLKICLGELKRNESSETDSVKKSLVTLEICQLQRVWASLLRQDFDDFCLDYERPQCLFWRDSENETNK